MNLSFTNWIPTIIAILICIGSVLFAVAVYRQRKFGFMSGERVYEDTSTKPGFNLYAKSINLVGRPDYLVMKKGKIIPIEVKTGKTPPYPYGSHIMQLMAYCMLVEEYYGISPPGGFIRYPDREFHIAYTPTAREEVIAKVRELTLFKQQNTEMHCTHPEHNQ